jgi:hypothetical protein
LSKHFTMAFEALVPPLVRQMPAGAAARVIGGTDNRP